MKSPALRTAGNIAAQRQKSIRSAKMADIKYMNPAHYSDQNFFSVEQLWELKQYFERMAIVWASGLDEPSPADKLAYAWTLGALKHLPPLKGEQQ